MGQKGTNTTTNVSTPNPQAMGAYQQLMGSAYNTAQTPFSQYGGQFQAPVNAQQYAGIGGINQFAGFAQPEIAQGINYANTAAQPLNASQIAQYQNPWTSSVVGATQGQFDLMNKQALNNITGNAVSQGAQGGDRPDVAKAAYYGAVLPGQEQQIAGLESQGYTQGVQTAEQQQANMANAAYSLGNLGVSGQGAGLTGANAQVGAGTLEQTTQQAQNQALYNQFLMQQAYPFQTQQWLAGIDTGVGSQMGGTRTTTGPPPNLFNQIAGVGIGALGLGALMPKQQASARGGRIAGFADGGAPSFGGMPYSGVSGYVPSMQITMGQGAPKSNQSTNQPQQPDYLKQLGSLGKAGQAGVSGLGNAASGMGNLADNTFLGGMDATNAAIATGEAVLADGGGVPGFAEGGHVHRPHKTHQLQWLASYQPNNRDIDFGPPGRRPMEAPADRAMDMHYARQRLAEKMRQRALSQHRFQDEEFAPMHMAALPGWYHARGGGVEDEERPPHDTSAMLAVGPPIMGGAHADNENRSLPLHMLKDWRNWAPGIAGRPQDYYDYQRQKGLQRPKDPVNPNIPVPYGPLYHADGGGVAGFADGGAPEWESNPLSAADEAQRQSLQRQLSPAYAGGAGAAHQAQKYMPGGGSMIVNDLLRSLAENRARKRLAPLDRRVAPFAGGGRLAPAKAGVAGFADGGGDMPEKWEDNPLAGAPILVGDNSGEAGDSVRSPQQRAGMDVAPALNPPGEEGGGGKPAPAEAGVPLPGEAAPAPAAKEVGFGINLNPFGLSPEVGRSLMAAGAGMLASKSPFRGVGVGEGIGQGLAQYGAEETQKLNQKKVEQNAKHLDQMAKQAQQHLNLQSKEFSLKQQQAQFSQMQPVKIGANLMGDIYAVKDPKDGRYYTIDQQTGQIRRDQPALAGVGPEAPGAVAPQSGAAQTLAPLGSMRLQAVDQQDLDEPVNLFGDKTDAAAPLRTIIQMDQQSHMPGTNPDALIDPNLSSGLRGKVKAIAEGRLPALPTSGSAVGGKENRYVMQKVMDYDPHYDATVFPRRQRTENFMSVGTQGGGGQQVVALNRAAAHAASLLAIAEKMDQGPLTNWNDAVNALARRGVGSKERQDLLGQWEVNSKGVGDEFAKVFAGSNTALGDREHWEKILASGQPLSVIKAELRQALRMSGGALDAITHQYNEGTRMNHRSREFLAPQTREIFDAINNNVPMSALEARHEQQRRQQHGFTAPAAGTAAAPPTAIQTATNPKTGQKVMLKDGQWVPMQ